MTVSINANILNGQGNLSSIYWIVLIVIYF